MRGWLLGAAGLMACGGAGPQPEARSQVCVVRHAEAVKNLDPPPADATAAELDSLTPAGEARARAAGGELPAGVARVWSSPANRARQTAVLLGRGEVAVEPALRPLDGAVEWKVRAAAWAAGDDPRPAGGESLGDGAARVRALLDRLRGALGPGEHAVWVTHGDIASIALGELRGTPLLARPERDTVATGGVVCVPLDAGGDEAGCADCLVDGRCAERGGQCVAADDADCAASDGCRRDGRCVAREGRCVRAAGVVDCAASEGCRLRGECRMLWGSCVAQRDADCAASAVCADAGRCVVAGAECVTAAERSGINRIDE